MDKLQQLQEQRNKLITDAQAVALLDVQTSETRDKFKTMMTDVDVLEVDINNLKRANALEAESRSTARPPRPNPSSETRTDAQVFAEDQAKAFEKYIKRGMTALNPEERSLLERRDITTTGASGNVAGSTMIPQQFLNVMIEAQKLIGNTVSLVRKKITNNNGAPIKIALSNDTANNLTTLTAEAAEVTEQDPAFSGFVLSTDTITTLVRVSRQDLDDSYFDLADWLKQKFGVRYYRGLEYLITNGNASNVASIVAGATLGANATGVYAAGNANNLLAGQNGPVYDDFVTVYGSQDPAYVPNSKWVMNSNTRAYLMGQKDLYGRPLFIPSPNTGTLDQILGCGVVMNQALPSAVNSSTTTAATGILFGDFEEGYILRTDGDLSILRLDERYADTLEVGFIGYARIGGAATDAGTHPIRTLVTPLF